MIIWLTNNYEPMSIVLEKWTKTSAYRYQKLIQNNEELSYFQNYPAIRGATGYQLVSLYILKQNVLVFFLCKMI